jgi:hypothetical protein
MVEAREIMKKLIVIVGVLLALAAPAWAVTTVYPDDGTGGTSVYPDPSTGGGGGAGFANIEDWTLATGIETNGPFIFLSNTATDSFDNASIDSTLWNTSTSGTGTVTEASGRVLMNSPAANDSSIFYVLRELDRTEVANYTLYWEYAANLVNQGPFTLWSPTVVGQHPQGVSSATSDWREIQLIIDGAGTVQFFKRTAAGATLFWNPTTDSWQVAAATFYSATAGTEYTTKFNHDDNDWTFEVWEGSTLKGKAYSSWATTWNRAGQDWIIMGDMFTDGWTQSMKLNKAVVTVDTLTTSPVAQSGNITVGGATITQLRFNEQVTSGCTLTYDHTSDGSTTAGDTLAAMRAAVVGTTPTTFSVDVNMNGNGSCQSQFWLDGSGLTH